MSIFDRRPRLRWAVPAAAGVVIAAGTLIGTVGASADAGLEPKTAQDLLVSLQSPQAAAMSGTVVATADLGLPELPMGAGSGTDVASLASGSHTFRVWSDGPERARVALIGDAAESDVVRNGRDVWAWSSTASTVDHYVLPEKDSAVSQDHSFATADLPSTPQEAAAMALQAIDPTTTVSTSGVASVAGRAVYELTLTPKQADTLVDRVVLAVDAETSVPLRVQVFSRQMADPAYEVAFTSVDFSRPDQSLFTFTPPPGATVTEHPAVEPTTKPTTDPASAGLAEPTVVGTGWSQVAVGAVPADMLAGLADGSQGGDTRAASGAADALALLGSLPATSGPWGSGRVLSGTLVSAILTDDGRFAIGAVTPEALGAALAAQ